MKMRACTASLGHTNAANSPPSLSSCTNPSTPRRPATLSMAMTGQTGLSHPHTLENGIAALQQLKKISTDGAIAQDLLIRFVHFNGTIAAVYAPLLTDASFSSVFAAFESSLKSTYNSAKTLIGQLCGQGQDVLGIALSSGGDFHQVRRAVVSWSSGKCHSISGVELADRKVDVELRQRGLQKQTRVELRSTRKRDECTTATVVSGDSCTTLASKCALSGDDFTKFNKKKDLCSTLQPGQRVCCSQGTLPDAKPKTQDDGTCAVHEVIADDNCSQLAAKYDISVKDIESFNKGTTWGWAGCKSIMIGTRICVSKGNTPLPAPVPNATCGPTKPGTEHPGKGKNISDLNPCPLNACCNIWGQCGITREFCWEKRGATGNPGTAPKGVNGCVSNCGIDIYNKKAPSVFQRIGYYEAWNDDRDCLHMDAIDAARHGAYDIIHWAFAEINTDDWTVVIKDPGNQWSDFKKLQETKKVVAFGGWAYSTEAATYNILRQAISPANRELFALNVAKFLDEHDLHGVDFDWEYPGAEIVGTPAGQPDDGVNYLEFLKVLRGKLDKRKSMSIAAPASYFYLQNFPIKDIGEIVDYIVYMTYDLHGQWDSGSKWSQEGCPGGNCLRSHVNTTEIWPTLTMITKAGVSTGKIFVGEASYGRSFKMAKAGCTGVMCEFLGDSKNSPAKPGRCTKTAGFLANAEIEEIKKKGNGEVLFDKLAQTDILVYDDTEWVAYTSEETKAKRRKIYQYNHFAGTVDWAVDLQTFDPRKAPEPAGHEDGRTPNTHETASDGQGGDTLRPGEQHEQTNNCAFFDPPNWDRTRQMCVEPCRAIVDKAKEKGEMTNYGCVGNFPVDQEIPYRNIGGYSMAFGVCACNNPLVNDLFQTFMDAMAAIAQVRQCLCW